MSEKNEAPEIIYATEVKMGRTWTDGRDFASGYYDYWNTYILKATYDKDLGTYANVIKQQIEQVSELKAEIERLKGKEEYVCPNQCDWIGMFEGELCDECKKREQ